MSLRKFLVNKTRVGQFFASFKLEAIWSGLPAWRKRRYRLWLRDYLNSGYVKSARLKWVIERILNEDY